MKWLIITGLLIFILCSCNKENRKGCWRGYDALLNETGVYCVKTKAEALATPYTYYVYPEKETRYCWRVNGTYHLRCVPQSLMEEYPHPAGTTYVKEDCTSPCP